MATHRVSVKASSFKNVTAQRRAQQAKRQSSRRRDAVDRARQLALAVSSASDDVANDRASRGGDDDAAAPEHGDEAFAFSGGGASYGASDAEVLEAAGGEVSMEEEGGRGESRSRRRARRSMAKRRHFARQLQLPDWMTAVPADLGSAWYFLFYNNTCLNTSLNLVNINDIIYFYY